MLQTNLQSRLIMVEGILQVKGEVIHVIVSACYDFSRFLRNLTAAQNEELPLLTLSRADEKSIPPGLDERSQPRESSEQKIFHGENFK
jgi:error-prone DNA polymerase